MAGKEVATAVQRKIILKETGNFLLLYPVFSYNDIDVNILERGKQVKDQKGKPILRHQEDELVFLPVRS